MSNDMSALRQRREHVFALQDASGDKKDCRRQRSAPCSCLNQAPTSLEMKADFPDPSRDTFVSANPLHVFSLSAWVTLYTFWALHGNHVTSPTLQLQTVQARTAGPCHPNNSLPRRKGAEPPAGSAFRCRAIRNHELLIGSYLSIHQLIFFCMRFSPPLCCLFPPFSFLCMGNITLRCVLTVKNGFVLCESVEFQSSWIALLRFGRCLSVPLFGPSRFKWLSLGFGLANCYQQSPTRLASSYPSIERRCRDRSQCVGCWRTNVKVPSCGIEHMNMLCQVGTNFAVQPHITANDHVITLCRLSISLSCHET